jgi:integrase
VPKKRLTEEGIARLKAPVKGKQIDYYDGVVPGLTLRVNYGGRKTWRVLDYIRTVPKSGKRKGQPTKTPRMTALGRFPIMGLKQAREAAKAFLIDPEKALAATGGDTFSDIAADYVKRHIEKNGLRTAYEIKRCIAKYIEPPWGPRQFRDIKRSDVTKLLDRIEDDHGSAQADLCLSYIRALMNWHASRDDDYFSPLVRGMKRRNHHDSKRDRTLNDDEIRCLWRVAGELGAYGAMLKVLLLTGQRRAKVLGLTWEQLVGNVWDMPKADREKDNPRTLRLPRVVRDLIEQQPRLVGNPRVFATVGSLVRHKADLDRRMRALLGELEPWVIHDLRRTARSLMARAGVARDHAERVLGHALPGIEGTYDRHGYVAEKAQALRRLAAEVSRIVEKAPGKAVHASGRRRAPG